MNDPFRPTADTRPMPRPWGETALIAVASVLSGLVVAYVAEAIVTETIAASIEARSFIGGQP
ncbi:hypothetical protein [Roseovarius indicus]|uniref:hypothetical protein n=1 Tax=Roseovarius indicus TaxID=540747 RepID=UPI0007D9815D|nr:hypothetical protein [Roseovarius indicus]OAO02688.1 hypothetical protein A8B76_04930 [Roseovarius indicus]